MHATGLEWRISKVIPVRLGETGPEVGDHTQQRMARVEARLGFEEGESVGGLGLEHERVHDVLGRVIDSDKQAVPAAPNEDHLAVDAENPTPRRPQVDGYLERGLRLSPQF